MAEKTFNELALELAKTYISSYMQRDDVQPIQPDDLEEIMKKAYAALKYALLVICPFTLSSTSYASTTLKPSKSLPTCRAV